MRGFDWIMLVVLMLPVYGFLVEMLRRPERGPRLRPTRQYVVCSNCGAAGHCTQHGTCRHCDSGSVTALVT